MSEKSILKRFVFAACLLAILSVCFLGGSSAQAQCQNGVTFVPGVGFVPSAPVNSTPILTLPLGGTFEAEFVPQPVTFFDSRFTFNGLNAGFDSRNFFIGRDGRVHRRFFRF